MKTERSQHQKNPTTENTKVDFDGLNRNVEFYRTIYILRDCKFLQQV